MNSIPQNLPPYDDFLSMLSQYAESIKKSKGDWFDTYLRRFNIYNAVIFNPPPDRTISEIKSQAVGYYPIFEEYFTRASSEGYLEPVEPIKEGDINYKYSVTPKLTAKFSTQEKLYTPIYTHKSKLPFEALEDIVIEALEFMQSNYVREKVDDRKVNIVIKIGNEKTYKNVAILNLYKITSGSKIKLNTGEAIGVRSKVIGSLIRNVYGLPINVQERAKLLGQSTLEFVKTLVEAQEKAIDNVLLLPGLIQPAINTTQWVALHSTGVTKSVDAEEILKDPKTTSEYVETLVRLRKGINAISSEITTTTTATLSQSKTDNKQEPWEQIPDSGWNRQAVKLLWAGFTDPEIAEKIDPDLSSKTVTNKLSFLRRMYPKFVPTRKELKKLGYSGY